MNNKKLLTTFVLSVLLISFISAAVYQTPGAVISNDTELNTETLNESADNSFETIFKENLWLLYLLLLIILLGIFSIISILIKIFEFIVGKILKMITKKKAEHKNLKRTHEIYIRNSIPEKEQEPSLDEELDKIFKDSNPEDTKEVEKKEEEREERNLYGQQKKIKGNTERKEEPSRKDGE